MLECVLSATKKRIEIKKITLETQETIEDIARDELKEYWLNNKG
jgi:hypothetical protein